HLNEAPPKPSTRVAEIPKTLDELIVTMMAKNPPDRPWDAAAVGDSLTKLRDKAERGAKIAMVWPASEPEKRKASRSASETGGQLEPTDPRKKPRKPGSIAALAPPAILGSTGSLSRPSAHRPRALFALRGPHSRPASWSSR